MRNVKRFREDQKLTYVELSDRLTGLGRPIPVLGLRRIERGERRVDVDDLMALADALQVMPADLLIPASETPEEEELAARLRARITGTPAPWGEVQTYLFRLALSAAFSPSATKTIRTIVENGLVTEDQAASISQVIRSSWEMRGGTNRPPEEEE